MPLGAHDVDALQRQAHDAGQTVLRADCGAAADKADVMQALGAAFALPPHFGRNLDALYDCLLDLRADPAAAEPGFLVIVRDLPAGETFDDDERDALLAVFRDAAQHHCERGTTFRVLYSVRSE